jgi:hypothetical protein
MFAGGILIVTAFTFASLLPEHESMFDDVLVAAFRLLVCGVINVYSTKR